MKLKPICILFCQYCILQSILFYRITARKPLIFSIFIQFHLLERVIGTYVDR